jgi:single-stranded DNA-binding protein
LATSTEDLPAASDATAQRDDSLTEIQAKGSALAVDGRLEWREWETDGGAKRQAVAITGEQDGDAVDHGQDRFGAAQPLRCAAVARGGEGATGG